MQGLDNFLPKVGQNDDQSSISTGVAISLVHNELILHQDSTIQFIKVVADVPVWIRSCGRLCLLSGNDEFTSVYEVRIELSSSCFFLASVFHTLYISNIHIL